MMLRSVILKRMRLNVLSLRFLYGLILIIGLGVLSGVVSTQTLNNRIQYAQARQLEWRNALETARHYESTYGQVVFVPPILSLVVEGIGDRFGMAARADGHFGRASISGRAQSNRLLAFLPIDLSHVVALILSLLAILFTYDAISGERESGTLRLILSNSIARSTLLFGEYLATLMTLLVALIPAVLIWLLVVRKAGLPSFTADEWKRLAVFFIATFFFTSIYVTIGLLLSSTLRHSTTSLMLGLFIWVMTTSLYPSLAAWSAVRFNPLEVNANAAQRTTLNQMAAQAELARTLQLASPVHIFYALSSRVASTDLEAYLRFVNYADRYQEEVAQWHRQKLSLYPEREHRWHPSFGLLDIDGFPQPAFKGDSLTQAIVSSLPYLSLLIVFNGVLMLASLFAVSRYDPR
jgi:ABC-type transport system involved in multi-copper enzyme maturation permease subunit